ncbi:helix-turn-helix transcriptional regulator [Salinifilum aidingensis]
MVSTANTPRARQLGAELRRLRKEAGLTINYLAQQIGRGHAHVSRWENGKLTPSEDDVAALLNVLGADESIRASLLELAREVSDPHWLSPGVERQRAVLTEYERSSTRIIDVEPLLIPGLLQTADYARSIMSGAGASRGEAEERVMFRLGRREVLTRRNRPAQLHAFIGEAALRNPPCAADVMDEQLRELLAWNEQENVVVQVVPFGTGYTAATEGLFVLLESDAAQPVVHLEHYRASATVTDSSDVRAYQDGVDRLRAVSLSEVESAEFIAGMTTEKEGVS